MHVRQLMDTQWEEDVSRVKKADRVSALCKDVMQRMNNLQRV